jgi:hypothetical protein
MKRVFFAVSATVLLFIGSNAAAQQTEETCKNQVVATITAIETREQQTGQEQSLKGLTKKDIQEMLKTKTPCEVMQEINRRTQK